VDGLMKHGRVRRGFLGVRLWDIDRSLVEALKRDDTGISSLKDLIDDVGLKEPRGAFIYKVAVPDREGGVREFDAVEKDTPAHRAGLKEGDVIVALDGRPVAGVDDFNTKMAQVVPGTTVTVKVLRDRKEREFKIEVAERPQEPPRPRRR
jgi:serine protease Do